MTMELEALALSIGNSRLHFAGLRGDKIEWVAHAAHLRGGLEELPEAITSFLSLSLPLYLASVVPQQTEFWELYPHTEILTLADLPIQGLYPTMGIDRALALYGALRTYGAPCLVIDGGTALTFTGAVRGGNGYQLAGGSILPGLGTQFQSLYRNTAALPYLSLPLALPERWCHDTNEAIASGILYTVLAGVQDFLSDWGARFPKSAMVVTGGDQARFLAYWRSRYPESPFSLIGDPYLIFAGIQACIHGRMKNAV
ncbi:pantothenate kinase [Spirulina subsalsa FACHB-351]|uniref:Type III pantothenate kinase n=1 Tax=Spirulina subsalsa FACHB-351 TaxID=234711 RepID=A0ABT3L1U8_9CYAN|nr:pantothenate kinase [Spirulina subsalsa]MCW6035474.1 pantothenate kinase [Spirulina subsalsa FACHB-351]